MKHINPYRNFLIKESAKIADINLIKELIDDYFLEYIEESENIQSGMILDFWVDPKDLDKEAISFHTDPTLGYVPFYKYKLKFKKYLSIDRIKLIQNRLNSDKQFKIINFGVKSGYEFEDSTLAEYTAIDIRLVYLLDEPLFEPDIVTKMREPLEKLGYKSIRETLGRLYIYTKYKEFKLDVNEAEELFPISSFYQEVVNLNELKDKLLEFYKFELDQEWNHLKDIIPNLPKLNIMNVTLDDGFPRIELSSRVGKIKWFIYLKLIKKSQDITIMKVNSNVSYYDEIKNYST